MSSSDSSGVRTWGPQNGGYNLDSYSDASDWSLSPRPSSSRSPVFAQQRYGPSSRQPFGRGNQYGSSTGRPKSGRTSRNPDYRDGHPAVERELFRKPDHRQTAWDRQPASWRNQSANQRSTEDKVQAVVTQTVVKRRGSVHPRPRKRRSTDQYPNVEERSPEIHATPVPVG